LDLRPGVGIKAIGEPLIGLRLYREKQSLVHKSEVCERLVYIMRVQ
jgi:hypothetical protein